MLSNENDKVEFKESFDHEDFEAEVVSFLNEEGGTVYIGIANDGSIRGITDVDGLMLRVSESVLDRIAPDCSELVSIHEENIEGKRIVRVNVEKGYSLFHIKKYGHSPKGCFRRFGTRRKSMTQDEIDRRYRLSIPLLTIMEKKSPKKVLSFAYLKILLKEARVSFDDESFGEDFELCREDGTYNYMAYLLSDQFNESIKVARFRGNGDSGELVMRKEFGGGCIFKVFRDVLDYMDAVEHKVRTYFDNGLRRDEYLYDKTAFVEAWKNAVLHNSYHENQFPQIYLFDDHLEVMSHGNPLSRMTKEEFLRGKSKPLNERLMTIAINVDLTDQTGKGNKDIVKAYGPNAFEFSENFLTVRLPYNSLVSEYSLDRQIGGVSGGVSVDVVENDDIALILEAIGKVKTATTIEITEMTKIPKRTVERRLASLKQSGTIARVGSDKYGHWEIISKSEEHTEFGGVNGGVNGGVSADDHLQSILVHLKKAKTATTAEIASATGISKRTVERRLALLKQSGAIMRVGSDKNGHWEINTIGKPES